MMALSELTEFFGWATVINLSLFILTVLGVTFFQSPMVQIHQKLFRISEEDLLRAYFQYMGHFKILVVVFFLVPYVTLKIMN